MTPQQIIKELEQIQISIKQTDHNGDTIKANVSIVQALQALIEKL